MSTESTEPLISRAWLISAVGTAVALGSLFGLPVALGHTIEADAQTYADVVVTVVTAVGPKLLALFGRKKVTPLSNPRDADGNPLVPAGALPPVDLPAMPAEAPADDAASVLAAAAAIHPGVTA